MSWHVPCDSNQASTTSPGSDSKEDLSDAEGVWSADIEQSFQEALAIYPPCGRRKIILSDEGKMYGRNELIARYIKLRTGKTRTRKQVSSHIQVLARRKSKEYRTQLTAHVSPDQAAKEKALQTIASMSSAQIVSASAMHTKAMASNMPEVPPPLSPVRPNCHPNAQFWPASLSGHNELKPYTSSDYPEESKHMMRYPVEQVPHQWHSRYIAGPLLRMVEFSAFLEQQVDADMVHKHIFVHIGPNTMYNDPLFEPVDIRQIYDKFPDEKGGLKEIYEKGPQSAFFLVKFWADLTTNLQDENNVLYAVTSQYECLENIAITCSTKVCSFGKQVVEKVEKEYPNIEGGRYVYHITRSQMCEYMVNFINKLKQLPKLRLMNSVLENFTILQVVSNSDTHELLLCVAYVFEVSSSEHGAQHHIYRLVKD